jgi:hypothetical protein
MPELSRFYGIVIYMYYKEHNPPHFHINYNEFEAVFSMNEEAIIEGFIPSKQLRLILAWYELHSSELFENWEKMKDKKDFIKIKPLE